MTTLFEAALNEAVGKPSKPRYKAPDDPYDKFKSDLAREFTAKHFPFLFGYKRDKKVFRTPAYYFRADESSDTLPSYEYGGGSDELWLSRRGHGTDLVGSIVADGKQAEWFQNTNSYFADEGYTTDANFYYQGPTWSVRSYDIKKDEWTDFKSGLRRDELADAVIELYKTNIPRDYDGIYNELIEDCQNKIKAKEENIEEYQGMLDGTVKLSYTLDDWQRGRYRTFINGWEKEIKEYNTYLEAPALPPDLQSTEKVETKLRDLYYGIVDENPDPDGPNGQYAKRLHWAAYGFNKAEAVRTVKHSHYCSRRASTGTSKKPNWLAASVKCLGTITEEEFKEKQEQGFWRLVK